MQRSGSQTGLKIISIVIIILSLLGVIVGAILLAGGFLLKGTPEDSITTLLGVSYNDSTWSAAFGVIFLISSLIDFVVGIFGVRGANNPEKIMPFYVIAIIGVILEVIEAVISILNGSFSWSSVVSIIIIVVIMVLASNIKKQRDAMRRINRF